MEGRETAGFLQLDTGIQLVNLLPNSPSPLTWLLGGLGQRALHRSAVGIVPTADPTLVILLQGANLLVTADVLAPRGGKDKPGVTCLRSSLGLQPCSPAQGYSPAAQSRVTALWPSPSLHHLPLLHKGLVPRGKIPCPQGAGLSPGQGKDRDSPTRAPHHALAPHADAVGVLVAAAGPVVNNLVHEHHVSRALGLADQLTLLSLCGKGKGKGRQREVGVGKGVVEIHYDE